MTCMAVSDLRVNSTCDENKIRQIPNTDYTVQLEKASNAADYNTGDTRTDEEKKQDYRKAVTAFSRGLGAQHRNKPMKQHPGKPEVTHGQCKTVKNSNQKKSSQNNKMLAREPAVTPSHFQLASPSARTHLVRATRIDAANSLRKTASRDRK